ncbi:C40 family peptidase, partial [Lactobacillus acetotolerans]
VVNLAEQQVGKGYGWGANGPDSFDCSSLVQYVYQQAAGINLPRTTYDQVKVGEDVPLDQLQPGDLLFWGSTTAPYHVAIYVGNNQYVNAATPEQGVILQIISSYYYPTCARRVLQ